MNEREEKMEKQPVERSSSLGAGSNSPSRNGKGDNGKGQGGKNRREYGYRNQKQHFSGPPIKGNQGYTRPSLKYGAVPDKKPQSRRQMGKPAEMLKEELNMCGFTGSAFPKFNKKQPLPICLNHLLNFTYEPRQNDFVPIRSRRKSNYTPFNKEQFLQANCQFVVQETGDYTVHAVDSDVLVDWKLIEQVCIFSHEVPSCPICLFPPTAAKITRCGHIYCWSCVLHYLSLTDNTWQKCPICFEAIHATELKSVVSMETHRYTKGEQITLRLMQRVKDSVVAVPKSQWKNRDGKPYSISDTDVNTCFVKLLVASTEDVLNKVIKKEKEILKQQLKEAKSEKSGDEPFVQAALAMVEAREKELQQSIKNEGSVNDVLQGMKDLKGNEEPQDSNGNNIVSSWRTLSPTSVESVDDYEAAFSDDEKEETNSDNARGSTDILEKNLPGSTSSDTVDSLEDVPQNDGSPNDPYDGEANVSSIATVAIDVIQDDVNAVKPNATADDTTETEIAESTTVQFDTKQSNACCNDASKRADDDTASSASGNDTGMISEAPGPECYYFYQADDGQNIFLHPVNVQCLIKEYGSLQNSPEFITGTVIEMAAFSQTQDLRKRFRYLSHLPLTCEYVVCELDLKPPLLSINTLHEFRDTLRQRKWYRQKKAKEEKKRERKYSGKDQQPAMKLSLSSERDFPQNFPVEYSSSYEDFSSPTAERSSSAESSCASSVASSPPGSYDEIGSGSPDGMRSVPSFAQALRSGKLRATESRANVPRKTDAVEIKKQEGSESDHEDYVPVPTFQTAFSAALFTANWDPAIPDTKQDVGRKQKKAKKKLLFTTSAVHKYH